MPQLLLYGFGLMIGLWAFVSDLRTRKIPNPLVMVGMMVVVLLQILLTAYQGQMLLPLLGQLLGGMAVPMFLFPLFMIRALGAGDIKLMMVLGLILGPKATFWVLLYSLIFGGLLALAVFARHLGWRGLWGLFLTAGKGLRQYPQMQQTFPYSGAIVAGYAWVLYSQLL